MKGFTYSKRNKAFNSVGRKSEGSEQIVHLVQSLNVTSKNKTFVKRNSTLGNRINNILPRGSDLSQRMTRLGWKF